MSPLDHQLVRHREFSGERYNIISLYAWDEPIDEEQASALVVECQELFNIRDLKAKYFLMRVIQKGWSKKQFEDAIAWAFDNNKIPTQNVGMEPGNVLSYERKIKLYTYEEYLLSGLKLQHALLRELGGYWWVDKLDYHELVKRDVVIDKQEAT